MPTTSYILITCPIKFDIVLYTTGSWYPDARFQRLALVKSAMPTPTSLQAKPGVWKIGLPHAGWAFQQTPAPQL